MVRFLWYINDTQPVVKCEISQTIIKELEKSEFPNNDQFLIKELKTVHYNLNDCKQNSTFRLGFSQFKHKIKVLFLLFNRKWQNGVLLNYNNAKISNAQIL